MEEDGEEEAPDEKLDEDKFKVKENNCKNTRVNYCFNMKKVQTWNWMQEIFF